MGFKNSEKVAQALDNNPVIAVMEMERILGQDALDALYAALVPEPSDEQKAAMVDSAEAMLREALGESASAVVALQADKAKLMGTVEEGTRGKE